MKIVVTGVNGRVGAALAGADWGGAEIVGLTRREMDLADLVGVEEFLEGLECDVFLHPAAMTSLEMCEMHPELARVVNQQAAGVIARWAAKRGVKMVYFSTDYVFDGRGAGKLQEEERVSPLSEYGRTKAAGEREVLAVGEHLVMRVSWVFGPEKPSFIDGVVSAVREGREVVAIADKWSIPTFTKDLVGWVRALVEQGRVGVVHACQSGEPVSWHGMAEHVVRVMAECGEVLEEPRVVGNRLVDHREFLAERPIATGMATERLTQWLGVEPRLWQVAIEEYVKAQSCGGGIKNPHSRMANEGLEGSSRED